MKKKIHSQLWIYFAAIIFIMLLLTACLLSMIGAFLYYFDIIGDHKERPLILLIFFVYFSVLVATGVSIVVVRKILRPITQLSEKMGQVAKGDFDVQVDEGYKIAEMEQLSRDFNSMVRELNSIETLRSDFIANVSHEFKTPLATIRGYVQLLQNNQLPEKERQEYIGRILDGTTQLSHLTENILRISKLESQGIFLDEKSFRLDEQIRNVILFLEPEWNSLDIEWEIDLPKVICVANEEIIYQVWLNLLENAIKYSSKQAVIAVQLQENQAGILVQIKDNGLGMTPEVQKHMFDKFYQGDTAHKAKGNGLGLALVKKIIDLYHGRISVESEVNQGTLIEVWLPHGDISKEKV